MNYIVYFSALCFLFHQCLSCVCDQTNQCDVLCCCDPECTDADKAKFKCNSSTNETSLQYECIPKNVFSKINSNRDLFYLERDDSYCFTQSTPSDILNLQKTLPRYTTSSFSGGLFFDTLLFGATLQENRSAMLYDPIYFISNNRSKPILLLSSQSYTSSCARDTVLYLRNSSISCTLGSVTEDICKPGSDLDYKTFEVNKILQKYSKPFSSIDVVNSCIDDTTKQSVSPCPAISYSKDSNGSCNNILTNVLYTFVHGGPDGITSVNAVFTLGSARAGDPAVITTVVRFNSATLYYPDPVNRNLIRNTNMEVMNGTSKIMNRIDKSLWYPFSDNSYAPIVYPTSNIVGISKDISNINDIRCAEFSSFLISSIPDRIAKYRNANPESASDWINISSIAPDITCSTIPTFLDIVVLHRSSDSVQNPNNEIISASVRWGTSNFTLLKSQELLGNEFVFYYSVRFVSLDQIIVNKERNALDQIFRAFPRYRTPTLLFIICILIFILLSALLLIVEQQKHAQ